MALPDLVPVASAANPYLSVEDFAPSACAVGDGCTSPGQRRLLRMTSYTQNIGPDDLHLGDPTTNSLFEFDACHGHYHLKSYLGFRLLTTTGTVAASTKSGFCLLDSIRWSTTASLTAKYNCTDQGMQAGWGDIYQSTLDCQYVDVTDVPPGQYILELHVNPAGVIAEANYDNNVTTVAVTIDALAPVPQNDDCVSATDVLIASVPQTGSTETATGDGQGCGGSSGLHDVWFKYTPQLSGAAVFSTCGSAFSTVLSVHSGCPGTIGNMLGCNIQSTGPFCSGSQQSEVTLQVVGSVTYLIRISGLLGANGVYRLEIAGPGNSACEATWTQYR